MKCKICGKPTENESGVCDSCKENGRKQTIDIRPIIGAVIGALVCGIIGFFVSFSSTVTLICILLGIIIGFLISSYIAKQKPADNVAVANATVTILIFGAIGFIAGYLLTHDTTIGIIGAAIGIAIGHMLIILKKRRNDRKR